MKHPLLKTSLMAGILAGSLGKLQAQTEVYSCLFAGSNDAWESNFATRSTNWDSAQPPVIAWFALDSNGDIRFPDHYPEYRNGNLLQTSIPAMPSPSTPGTAVQKEEQEVNETDSIPETGTRSKQEDGLMLFSFPGAKNGDFFFIYKAFGGLRPNSLYRISSLASFSIPEVSQNSRGRVHLKMGASMGLPQVSNHRYTVFEKGEGAESGKDIALVGSLPVEPGSENHRYYTQNYDHPLLVSSDHAGRLYVIIGIEPEMENGPMPDVCLHSLRLLFDYTGKDSAALAEHFRVEIKESETGGIFRYRMLPEEEVLQFSIYSEKGHLILVENELDCLPVCPGLIDATLLPPGMYWVEFLLPDQRKIVSYLNIK